MAVPSASASGRPADRRGFEWHLLWNRAKPAAEAPTARHWSTIITIAMSQSGRLVAFGSHAGSVGLREASTMNIIGTIGRAHPAEVTPRQKLVQLMVVPGQSVAR